MEGVAAVLQLLLNRLGEAGRHCVEQQQLSVLLRERLDLTWTLQASCPFG
jgi:hypothetical protein